jgi:hypothetical protein
MAAEHEHSLFSEASSHAGASDDHHASHEDDDRSSADNMAGGHHHHSDSGSGMLVHAAIEPGMVQPAVGMFSREGDSQVRGLATPGQERPPKVSGVSA